MKKILLLLLATLMIGLVSPAMAETPLISDRIPLLPEEKPCKNYPCETSIKGELNCPYPDWERYKGKMVELDGSHRSGFGLKLDYPIYVNRGTKSEGYAEEVHLTFTDTKLRKISETLCYKRTIITGTLNSSGDWENTKFTMLVKDIFNLQPEHGDLKTLGGREKRPPIQRSEWEVYTERVVCTVPIPIYKNEITITVSSNGCTDKTHFRFVIVEPEPEHHHSDQIICKGSVELVRSVRFIRIKRDDCKMMDHEIKLTYSFEELGIKPN